MIKLFPHSDQAIKFAYEKILENEPVLILPAESIVAKNDQVFVFPVAFGLAVNSGSVQSTLTQRAEFSDEIISKFRTLLDEVNEIHAGYSVVLIDRWMVELAPFSGKPNQENFIKILSLCELFLSRLSEWGSSELGSMPKVPLQPSEFYKKEYWIHLGLS